MNSRYAGDPSHCSREDKHRGGGRRRDGFYSELRGWTVFQRDPRKEAAGR